MTEEEYFRKNYPDSCYGDKPLSPHWDFFQDGVEFGERQSEKQIEELKGDLELWESGACKASNVEKCGVVKELENKLSNVSYQLEGRDNEIAELKKACDETQELLDKQIEATYKLDKENAELKEKLDYAESIVQSLLDNSDEYAEQRARDFLKETE